MKNRMPLDCNNPENDETARSSADLFELFSHFLRHKRLIFIITVLVMTLTAVRVMMLPNLYRSNCSILPSGKTDKLAELRQLTGMSGSISSDENSSELYPVILRSQLIIDAVLEHNYKFNHEGKDINMTFAEYCGTSNQDVLRNSLAGMTDISTDFQNGVIYISLVSRYPGFSQAVLDKYLEELELFDRLKRRSTATDNVLYLKRELAQCEDKLMIAEDSLESFQLANRNWDMTSSPEINKAITRLRREVEIKSRIYALLLEQYETARLNEQKDTPIISVLDPPTLPLTKSAPNRTVSVLLSGIVTFAILTLILIIVENIKRRCYQNDEKSLEKLSSNITEAFPRSTQALKLVRRVRQKETV